MATCRQALVVLALRTFLNELSGGLGLEVSAYGRVRIASVPSEVRWRR